MEFAYFAIFNEIEGKSNREAYKVCFEEIDAAEESGWDAVYVPCGHFASDITLVSAPLTLAAALAQRTRRLKIGTAIHAPNLRYPGELTKTVSTVPGTDKFDIFGNAIPQGGIAIPADGTKNARSLSPAFRNVFGKQNTASADPFVTAEEVATVDQVSEGRFIYGAGAASKGDPKRREHFFEFLEVMKKIWSEDLFSGHDGTYFHYPAAPIDCFLAPQTIQKPYPPILIPMEHAGAAQEIGSGGYRLAVGGGTSHNLRGMSALRDDIREYREAWRSAGHEGNGWVMMRIPSFVGATPEEARRGSEDIMNRARARAANPDVQLGVAGSASTATTEQANLFGTPEEVRDRIYELQAEFGIDEILFELNWVSATVPREGVINSIRLIADKVMPNFK